MIHFITSDSYTTLKFTARSPNVLLPKDFQKLDLESQNLLKHFIETARDLYIKRVSKPEFNPHSFERVRQECIKEAVDVMVMEVSEDRFLPLYNKFKSFHQGISKPFKLYKPKALEFTKLDLIENQKIK